MTFNGLESAFGKWLLIRSSPLMFKRSMDEMMRYLLYFALASCVGATGGNQGIQTFI